MDNISATGNFHLSNNSSVQLESKLQGSHVTASEMKKLKEACNDFEAIFIKQMLDAMKKTINRSYLTNRNMGEEIFDDMLYDEYSKKMSGTAGLGIGNMMYQQLSRQLPSDILS
ncbi:rod-binding protein [Oceanispirochaeta sp.]|jgi:flagellar protein FlgJ|uniref:rod-binding protein n=1 Tax=Oceanispirochaeta sp. TaxID=2035350 RepID=UPI00263195F2|nr:rod-binding protein [Oceanispirochaeta sp.]MDA3955314.1 rod-binding protein [Oceanispirochaeta sp.]